MRTLGNSAAIILLTILLIGGGLLAYRFLVDFNRETIQHSQGYVQTRIQELNEIIVSYNDERTSPGQKAALVNQFCYKVTLLIPEERPTNIVSFQSAHC